MEDHKKMSLLSKAKKIAEKMETCTKYELFQLENFYVEIRFCIQNQIKKIINTYLLKELPKEYAAELIAIPLVALYRSN